MTTCTNRLPKILAAGVVAIAALAFSLVCLTGCSADGESSKASIQSSASSLVSVTDSAEAQAVAAAVEKVKALGRTPRIVATSPAVVDICDKLGISLVGVPSSSLYELPERYEGLPTVGTSMTPDMETVASLEPDWILSPVSLQSDLEPKYKAIGVDYAFLNLNSVQGMFRSIYQLGQIFDCEDEANSLVESFTSYYTSFQEKFKAKTRPKVLVLMGLPGSYVIATKNSYVGSLVELAGGENVYDDEDEAFLTVNTEDMKTKEPDIILRAAHALPDEVQEMFAEDFETNDIWKHFNAVSQGRVYDLPYESFGMSATLDYQTALTELEELFYGNE